MSSYRCLLSGLLVAFTLVAGVGVAPAGPFTTGDILVTAYVSNNYTLLEYTPSGTLVQSITVPVVEPGTGQLRDVAVDMNGNAQMFNGTFNAQLTTYNPTTSTFTNTPITGGLRTENNVTYGGITAYSHYVFLANNDNGQSPLNGLVRVDVNNPSSQKRFADQGAYGSDFTQVAAGQDGRLYSLVGNNQINVYDPNTLDFIRSITPNIPTGDLRDIAVDPQGNIFGVSFYKAGDGTSLFEFDPNGNLIRSLALPTPYSNFVGSTVELSSTGQVLVGSPSGEVFLTNESFTGLTSFNVPTGFPALFATFVEAPPGPAAVTPEPAAGLSFGTGFVLLGLIRWRRRQVIPVG